MASRPLIIATLIGASVGVPYLTSKTPNSKPSANSLPASASYGQLQGVGATRLPVVGTPLAPLSPLSPGSAMSGSRLPLNGAQFSSVDQVLRFDVSKEWVYQN